LRELLQSGRRLLPERALEIVAGVLQALEYSHRNGIIHRDIKPGNVMLTRSGHVKVMDFGIARAVADVGATMTATAAVIGTAQYLSPEQAKGEHVDARSDIYSTGCLLYELLVGRPPFVGDSPVSVAYQHVREDPLPPSQFDPEIPPEIDAIVLKALAKNPENRYQSADEMRADIDRALDGRPVAAPAVVMAAGTAGAATQVMQPTAVIPGGTGSGAYGPGGPDGSGGPPGYQPPPKQNKGPMIALITLAVIAVFALAALIGRAIFGGDEGAKTQEVPSVLGSSEQAAVSQLQNAHFNPNVDDGCAAFNDQYASGQVYRQSPEGQTQATPNSAVTLCISKGTETVEVPDVRNKTPDDAKAELEDLGFKVQVVNQASADVDKDHVIGTNPAAGAKPKKGSTVKLLVSTGPEQVAVPSVVGKQRNDAENILRDAGFQVQVNEVDAPDEQPGTVLDQDPGAGAKVDPGTTVNLTVAKQPQQQLVTVRNVVGFTEDAAKQALENDGLKVKVQDQKPPDPTKPEGTVISQSIPPGTQVAASTEITITVNHPQGG
jgi:serine/threonine-protein kinase